MLIKLFDSELKVMEVLWERGDTSAKEIAVILGERINWSKTTTYTIIKRCLDKSAIERREPGFICHPLVTIEQVREYETNEFINKMYDGAAGMFVASILERKNLTRDEIERLKHIIEKLG